MLKLLPLFLLAAVHGQNDPSTTESVESIITDIFGAKPPNLSGVAKNDSKQKELSTTESCTRDDGRKGICVSYYLCLKDNTITTDGSYILDARSTTNSGSKKTKRSITDSPCPSYLDECCILPAVSSAGRNKSQSEALIPKPGVSKGEGCGWGNPDENPSSAVEGVASFGEFPWTCAVLLLELAIENEPSSAFRKYVGGASLIHPSIVLTTASVVKGASVADILVRAGEWDTQSKKEIYKHQDRKVESFVVHENFNYQNLQNDIAVIFLEKPVELAPNVAPVCLPPAGYVPPDSTRCFGTGWGKNQFGKQGRYQVLQKKVELPIVGDEQCENQLRKTRLSKYFQLHSSFICAGGEKGKDMCVGDGGAPLSCPVQGHPNRFIQSGIVSWGNGCLERDVPGVYVNVAEFRPWIDEKVTNKGYKPEEYTI